MRENFAQVANGTQKRRRQRPLATPRYAPLDSKAKQLGLHAWHTLCSEPTGMRSKSYTIVVGSDGSPAAEAALLAAVDWAAQHAPAELHLVRVLPSGGIEAARPAPQYGGLGTVPILSVEQQKQGLMQRLDSVLAKLPAATKADVRCFAHALIDVPVEGITSLARELQADVIAVGAHHHHGIRGRWLGSVTAGVVRQAHCPVLVVPPAVAHASGHDASEPVRASHTGPRRDR